MTHAEWTALARAAGTARRERPDVPLALATLVAVEGSSYRQPGARMLCDAEGRVLAGAVSGGCLEGDLALLAATVCTNGAGLLRTYDLSGELDGIWGLGASCDGVAHLLLEPLGDGAWLTELAALGDARELAAVVTSWTGAPDSLRVATRLVRPGARGFGDAPTAAAWRTQRAAYEAGPARGTFVAPVVPPTQLVIIGATRGAESLVRIARAAGWQVRLVEPRTAVLAQLALPAGVITHDVDPDGLTALIESRVLVVDARTAFAICTHRFSDDVAWLATILRLEAAPYVGVLGARARAARLLDAVAALGVNVDDARVRRRLFAPMGLDLGGESPDGIALATVAEIEAVLHNRPGGSLRARTSPLHGRTPPPAPAPVPEGVAEPLADAPTT